MPTPVGREQATVRERKEKSAKCRIGLAKEEVSSMGR